MVQTDKQAGSNQALWIFYGLILLLVLARLIPHPPNFTPIGAIGLLIGAYSRNLWHWLVPILAVLLSDMFIGFYHVISMVFVYLGIIASSFVGYYFLSKKVRIVGLLMSSITAASLFFLLSNFGVWLSAELYPMTWSGLISCYVAAIPFFGNTLAGYLFFSAIAFGAYEFFKLKRVRLDQHSYQ